MGVHLQTHVISQSCFHLSLPQFYRRIQRQPTRKNSPDDFFFKQNEPTENLPTPFLIRHVFLSLSPSINQGIDKSQLGNRNEKAYRRRSTDNRNTSHTIVHFLFSSNKGKAKLDSGIGTRKLTAEGLRTVGTFHFQSVTFGWGSSMRPARLITLRFCGTVPRGTRGTVSVASDCSTTIVLEMILYFNRKLQTNTIKH